MICIEVGDHVDWHLLSKYGEKVGGWYVWSGRGLIESGDKNFSHCCVNLYCKGVGDKVVIQPILYVMFDCRCSAIAVVT